MCGSSEVLFGTSEPNLDEHILTYRRAGYSTHSRNSRKCLRSCSICGLLPSSPFPVSNIMLTMPWNLSGMSSKATQSSSNRSISWCSGVPSLVNGATRFCRIVTPRLFRWRELSSHTAKNSPRLRSYIKSRKIPITSKSCVSQCVENDGTFLVYVFILTASSLSTQSSQVSRASGRRG